MNYEFKKIQFSTQTIVNCQIQNIALQLQLLQLFFEGLFMNNESTRQMNYEL